MPHGDGQNIGSVLARAGAAGLQGFGQGKLQEREDTIENQLNVLRFAQEERDKQIDAVRLRGFDLQNQEAAISLQGTQQKALEAANLFAMPHDERIEFLANKQAQEQAINIQALSQNLDALQGLNLGEGQSFSLDGFKTTGGENLGFRAKKGIEQENRLRSIQASSDATLSRAIATAQSKGDKFFKGLPWSKSRAQQEYLKVVNDHVKNSFIPRLLGETVTAAPTIDEWAASVRSQVTFQSADDSTTAPVDTGDLSPEDDARLNDLINQAGGL